MGLFGVAFGYLEGAVVVYLRYILYPDGFVFPLRPIPPILLAVEIGREAATMAMLWGAAWAAGGAGRLKFARFLYAFGLWDIFYYVALYVVLGWPASLLDWDILFLIPIPWLAPVLAPALVAALFVIVGGAGIWRRGAATVKPWQGILTFVGGLAILGTFLKATITGLDRAAPDSYPWAVFALGLAGISVAAAAAFYRRTSTP